MNFSVSRIFLLIVGAVLIFFGAKYLIASIPAKDIVMAIFSIVAMAAGFALMVGKGIHVSE
jgi:hypothetical protein